MNDYRLIELVVFIVCMVVWFFGSLYSPPAPPPWVSPGRNLAAWLAVLMLFLMAH